ncbi:MAG: transcription antitermination factor NusB [Actinomycetota bacterium]
MSSRTKERRAALELLYEADIKGLDPTAVAQHAPEGSFTRELVEGVAAHLSDIDETIGAAAQDWTVERMPAVDRAALRLACYELRPDSGTPPAVAIDEAVDSVKALSTEESGRFVNGVLGRIAREAAAGAGEPEGSG